MKACRERSKQICIGNHFKDKQPKQTIETAKAILCKLGIETTCTIKKTNLGSYTCRLSIVGTRKGVNGKGVNTSLALASAYGELFERLQNNAFIPFQSYKDELNFCYFYDEKKLTAEELMQQDNVFIKNIIGSLESNINFINNSVHLSEILSDSQCVCVPFQSLNYENNVYVPYDLLYLHYGTNGMCAGNSKSEALVQGICEIFERYCIKKIIQDSLTPPTIPISDLSDYPKVIDMISRISGRYNVIIKDCSLDGVFPVIALVVVERNSGKYGINFGSHPILEIALERAFTESVQGQNTGKFAEKIEFSFLNKNVRNHSNLTNFFTVAVGCFPYELFLGDSSYLYSLNQFLIGSISNQELFDLCVAICNNANFEVLIRDNSFLGFPAFQVIIPGVSELVDFDFMHMDKMKSIKKVEAFLMNPEMLKKEQIDELIEILLYFSTTFKQNSLSDYYKNDRTTPYPLEHSRLDVLYLVALLLILKHDYVRASSIFSVILNQKNITQEDAIWVRACKHLVEGLSENISFSKCIRCLNEMFDISIVNDIEKVFKNEVFLLVHQYGGILKENVSENLNLVITMTHIKKFESNREVML